VDRKTTIIAEVGENHHGAWDIAAKLTEEAAKNGADIVKFQSYLASDFSKDDPDYEWFERVAVPDAKHFEFKKIAEDFGAEFMSAPFSRSRAKFLIEEVGCKSIKVASGVMMNFEMLKLIDANAATVKKVYLSTGMATLGEIKEALGHLDNIDEVAILHCVTQYPAMPEQANLSAIRTLIETFPGHQIGFSDHLIGMVPCLMAVGFGATVLEKHFTLSRLMPGTDHICAMLPDELAWLCEQVEQVEKMIGDGKKVPVKEELEIRDFVRSRFRN
jgi:sialic acid synthase SpsE